MRKILLLTGLLLSALAVGCDREDVQEENFQIVGESVDPGPESGEQTQVSDATTEDSQESTGTPAVPTEIPGAFRHELEGLLITMPRSWPDKVEIEDYRNSYDGRESRGCAFYYREAADAGMGGLLFSFTLYDDPKDFVFLPSWEYVGTVKKAGKTRYLVLEYPTDVQYDEETKENYRIMQNELMLIVPNVKPGADSSIEYSTEKPAEVDRAHRRNEYVNAVAVLATSGLMPDGNDAEDWDQDMSNDQYTIMDVDGDGREELIITIADSTMAGMREVIYEYDVDEHVMREQFRQFPALTYYDNGVIRALASHNQGLAGQFWPYGLYSYNKETDNYDFVGFVDAWDQNVFPESFDGTPFPQEVDADGNGWIYQFIGVDFAEETEWLDDAALEQWTGKWIGNAGELELQRLDMTRENVNKLLYE